MMRRLNAEILRHFLAVCHRRVESVSNVGLSQTFDTFESWRATLLTAYNNLFVMQLQFSCIQLFDYFLLGDVAFPFHSFLNKIYLRPLKCAPLWIITDHTVLLYRYDLCSCVCEFPLFNHSALQFSFQNREFTHHFLYECINDSFVLCKLSLKISIAAEITRSHYWPY